ncbi:hypothetical protein CQ13_18760 [Bradyrhizobium retamae]|uniref:Uncharacterized protein n=1 Tax=Bradyrhizobium retamae TaxID=1300035 RepID=A0A0R3NER5_9BRAD|nr:hypothetical protein CQ13_18760 [Bradyrhizobium retamae]
MEVAPVVEVRPMAEVWAMKGVTMYEAGSAAVEAGCRTKAATVDRQPTASEPTAVKGRAATAEAAAMKGRSAAAEAAAGETAATTAAKAAAGETATTTAAAEATTDRRAVLNLGRQSVRCIFR